MGKPLWGRLAACGGPSGRLAQWKGGPRTAAGKQVNSWVR